MYQRTIEIKSFPINPKKYYRYKHISTLQGSQKPGKTHGQINKQAAVVTTELVS